MTAIAALAGRPAAQRTTLYQPVTAPEPQMLVVQPWDTNLVGTVAKAIQSADLGLNPFVDGNLVAEAELLSKIVEQAREGADEAG